jgi:hypothetical protein
MTFSMLSGLHYSIHQALTLSLGLNNKSNEHKFEVLKKRRTKQNYYTFPESFAVLFDCVEITTENQQ